MKTIIVSCLLLLSACNVASLGGEYPDAEVRCGLEGQVCCNEGEHYWCNEGPDFETQIICRNFEPGGTLNDRNRCEKRNARQQDGGVQ